MQQNSRFEGTKKLYPEKFENIIDKHIMIIGLGGVGSWCAEFLARSGVSKLTLIDMDDICLSNINRQVQAVTSNIGQFKSQELAKRLRDINPFCKVTSIDEFFTESSCQNILSIPCDFIIDAFDSVRFKALLLSECIAKDIKLITTGGAGGKKDVNKIVVKNFKRSLDDKLVAAVRRELKSHHKSNLEKFSSFYVPCVHSPEIVENLASGNMSCRGDLGSSVHITAGFALHITNYILDEFTRD